ncbi:MAG TPA: LysR family substrate-binding domain-containing protein [Propionibacteriaceae bacterium]
MSEPVRGLTVGFVPGVTLTKWRRTWADRHHHVPLLVEELTESEQRTALDDGRVDMCFVRLPVASEGLHVIPLYDEVAVVVVPKDHPVSLFEQVSAADLSEETVLEDVDSDDAFDLVAGGAGILYVPHSIARSHSRRDLVYRPVTDRPPTTVGLAWLVDNPHELIEDFIGIVRGRTKNSSRTPVKAPEESKAKTRKKAPPPAANRRRTPRGRR